LMASGFVEKRPWASVGFGTGVAFTSVLLASAKPSFALVGLIALLPVGVFFLGRDFARQKIALAGGAALSAALLLLPEHFLSRHDEVSRTFLPTSLFVNHADLIRDQMADDIQRIAATPYPREWLERVHAALSAEIVKSHAARPGHYWSFGFDPDYLMYDESSIAAHLRREFGHDVPALCAFYWYYYGRIWRERPFLVLKKTKVQMSIFYSEMCPAYNREKSLYLAKEYDQGTALLALPPYPDLWMAYPPAVEFVRRTELLGRSAPVIPQPLPLRMTLSLLAGAYRPLLWAALLASAVVLFQQRYRKRLGWLVVLVLFVYSYNAATCLEVAVLNSLEVRRYLTVQMFYTVFAQFLGVWLVCETALDLRSRKIPVNK
jgi:hypothetical protein